MPELILDGGHIARTELLVSRYDPVVVDVGGTAAPGLRERKKQRTRTMLIDAAIELCDRQGFERTTVDQIAAVADVSPRTFSRYFATKDAVIMALIDDAVAKVAVELTRQPADVSPLEALLNAHIGALTNTGSAPTGGLTIERLLSTLRIIMSSPVLRQTAAEFRTDATNLALAERMGVALDDRRLKLVATVWAAIVMTALGEQGSRATWSNLDIDTVISLVEDTFAQFIEVTAGLRQPV
jgi:AcrR family transcriptional regulator